VKSLKGKALGSVWACLRIVYREGLKGLRERAGLHLVRPWFFEALVGALLLGLALVSIGSLALVTEKLGHGRPPEGG